MSALLDLVYLAALGAASPYLAYKVAVRPRHVAGLRQRLGLGKQEPRVGDSPCVWVHGVSVGEVVAASPLIEGLAGAFPPLGVPAEVAITTTTATGQDVARHRFPGRRLLYYPIDFSWSVRRTFDAIRPSLVMLVELELWPNFLREARDRKVPVVVVNGRISKKSYQGYRLARRVIPLDSIAHYCVQTEEYAERFRLLGVDKDKITVTGSLKYDVVRTGGVDSGEMRAALGLPDDAIVWIAGSTHAPEERALVDVYTRLKPRFPKLRLVIAPRHIERSPDVARELEAATQAAGAREPVVLRSAQVAAQAQGRSVDRAASGLLLVDTIGELGRLYAAADLVFVGGSLIPHGGQNLLEPAGLGKAVVFGPHTFNFQESVERLLAAKGALQCRTKDELERCVAGLLADPSQRDVLGVNARAAIEQAKGATAKTFRVIEAVLSARTSRLNAEGPGASTGVRPPGHQNQRNSGPRNNGHGIGGPGTVALAAAAQRFEKE